MQIIKIDEGNLMGEWQKVKDGLEEGLDLIADSILTDFMEPTKTWDNPPEFFIEKSPLKRVIYTANDNYIRINDGTNRSGETVARDGGRLWLPDKFTSKTMVNSLYSRAGERNYTRGVGLHKSVKASSIKARNWLDLIYKKWTESIDLTKAIQDIIDRK